MAPAAGLLKSLVRSTTAEADVSDSPRISAVHKVFGRWFQDKSPDLGLDEKQARALVLHFEVNEIRLPALGATAEVMPAKGDGLCVLRSMLISQGQPDHDFMVEGLQDLAMQQRQDFIASNCQDESTCEVLEQEIKHELASGWFQGASQGLFAYAQEACFIVLSTSTPTEAILALGPVTFQQLLANMEHVSVSILGENQKQVDRRFVLIRHKHADPLKEDYMCEHYMPCLPAEGIHHSFDTCASEWAAYLQQLKAPHSVESTADMDAKRANQHLDGSQAQQPSSALPGAASMPTSRTNSQSANANADALVQVSSSSNDSMHSAMSLQHSDESVLACSFDTDIELQKQLWAAAQADAQAVIKSQATTINSKAQIATTSTKAKATVVDTSAQAANISSKSQITTTDIGPQALVTGTKSKAAYNGNKPQVATTNAKPQASITASKAQQDVAAKPQPMPELPAAASSATAPHMQSGEEQPFKGQQQQQQVAVGSGTEGSSKSQLAALAQTHTPAAVLHMPSATQAAVSLDDTQSSQPEVSMQLTAVPVGIAVGSSSSTASVPPQKATRLKSPLPATLEENMSQLHSPAAAAKPAGTYAQGQGKTQAKVVTQGQVLPQGKGTPQGQAVLHSRAVRQNEIVPQGKGVPQSKAVPQAQAEPRGRIVPQGKAVPQAKAMPQGKGLPKTKTLPKNNSRQPPSRNTIPTPEQQGNPNTNSRGFRKRVWEACKAAGISFAKGIKNVAAWLLHCPARAVSLIKDLSACILGRSRC